MITRIRDRDRFRAIFEEKSRLSYPICLLRTDCSQQCVSNKKNVGQCRSHEHAVAVLGQAAIAHTFVKPNTRLITPIECSTRARMCDLFRVFAWIASSKKCFHLHCRLVKSLAFGATRRITSLLALVRLIAVDPRLLAVQQVPKTLQSAALAGVTTTAWITLLWLSAPTCVPWTTRSTAALHYATRFMHQTKKGHQW